MPLLKLDTSVALSDEMKRDLLPKLSRLVAETIGKPEDYVMVTISSSAILMSGKPGDAAFVDIRSIGGLSKNVNQQFSNKICALLKDSLGLAADRVFLNFTDINAPNWGWKSSTIG